MGWLIAPGILILLGSVPLGVFVRYDSGGPLVRIVAGVLRFTVIPLPKKKKKVPKEKKEPSPAEEKKTPPKPVEEPEKKGGSLRDFYPLIQVGERFLNQFRRKLRVEDLVLKLILGGDDPCDLALNYGRAWACL